MVKPTLRNDPWVSALVSVPIQIALYFLKQANNSKVALFQAFRHDQFFHYRVFPKSQQRLQVFETKIEYPQPDFPNLFFTN